MKAPGPQSAASISDLHLVTPIPDRRILYRRSAIGVRTQTFSTDGSAAAEHAVYPRSSREEWRIFGEQSVADRNAIRQSQGRWAGHSRSAKTAFPLHPSADGRLSGYPLGCGSGAGVIALVQLSHLVSKDGLLNLVIVLSVGVLDLGVGQVQLRLRQLHNGGKAELVAALGKIEGQVSLFQ